MLKSKRLQTLSWLGIVALLATGSGCATVTGGCRDQNVKISSNPVGAAVLVDGQPMGQTPTAVKLCRKTEHHVEIAYPGCEPAQVTIARRLNPWLFGNILIGGPIGLVVDICTDATHNLSPDDIHVQLQAQKEPPNAYTASLK
jgi:PEGA domain